MTEESKATEGVVPVQPAPTIKEQPAAIKGAETQGIQESRNEGLLSNTDPVETGIPQPMKIEGQVIEKQDPVASPVQQVAPVAVSKDGKHTSARTSPVGDAPPIRADDNAGEEVVPAVVESPSDDPVNTTTEEKPAEEKPAEEKPAEEKPEEEQPDAAAPSPEEEPKKLVLERPFGDPFTNMMNDKIKENENPRDQGSEFSDNIPGKMRVY